MLREGVTISKPSKQGGATVIGEDCFLMANSHVGHDCRVADGVTLANNVMLAGHVEVGAGTFVGGGAGIHQFVRIGGRAMIGGNASISYDVPPFAMAAERNEVRGLNFVGLRRRKTPAPVVLDIFSSSMLTKPLWVQKRAQVTPLAPSATLRLRSRSVTLINITDQLSPVRTNLLRFTAKVKQLNRSVGAESALTGSEQV